MNTNLATRIRRLLERRTRHRLQSQGASPAAVLIPLFVDGDIQVLFTKRTETLPHHRGQVAFPGGRFSPTDGSLLRTAIREAHEEIGLRPEHVEVLGSLDDIHTMQSNFVITPFVGLIPHPYTFTPNPAEVAEIFSVPLATLEDPTGWREESWEFDGTRVVVTTIRHEGHLIWGATERISRNLIEALAAPDEN